MKISLTEAIDINAKMSDIDAQQHLDDKCVANGLMEIKVDTKVEEMTKVSGSTDTKQSAKPTTAANENGKAEETNEKEEIEDFNKNDSRGINKCTEYKNSTLPVSDENSFDESVVEKTNCNDIAIGASVAQKTDDQNGARINVENGAKNKSAENVAGCISSQTNNTTSVINELVDCSVGPEPMGYEGLSLPNTEIKDTENTQGSHIEKYIAVEEDLKKNGVLLKSAGENISDPKYSDKETTKKTVNTENKPIEDKPKGINEMSPSQTNNNSEVQSMERDQSSEMTANEKKRNEKYSLEINFLVNNIKDKVTTSVTSAPEENSDKNEVNSIEQTFLSQAKSSLIVNDENELILQEKHISKVAAFEKNIDEILLREDNIMDQDPLPGTDNLIVIKNANDTMFQINKEVSDHFAVKDSLVEKMKRFLPNDEPMEQENTSQVDVVDSPMEESKIMEKVTESSEHKYSDNFSETNETEYQPPSITDEISSPVTVSENPTREIKNTSSKKLDGVVVTDSIEGKKEEQTIEEIKVAETSNANCSQSKSNPISVLTMNYPTEVNKRLETVSENNTRGVKDTSNEKLDGVILTDSIEGKKDEQTIEEIKVADTSVYNCAQSKSKPTIVLTVKSPTEINKICFTAEIDGEKKTNDVDTTESNEIGEIGGKHNDLDMLERPVEVQGKERTIMDRSEDTIEKIETEATKIENYINASNQKEQNSEEQNNIPDQNEVTKFESSEREKQISDDEFALNYSDEECEAELEEKNQTPSKTEEILDTIIACMEVDRGDKKIVVETDKLEITCNKSDIPQTPAIKTKRLCNLSNTLDILSDDDDYELDKNIVKSTDVTESTKNSINIYNDDDVMLIDEEPISKEGNAETLINQTTEKNEITRASEETKQDPREKGIETINEKIDKIDETDLHKEEEPEAVAKIIEKPDINEKPVQNSVKKLEEKLKPVVPENFLKTFKNNVSDMTRENIEDLCLQLIVEGVLDRSNLSEIKTKLKTTSSSMDEWRKKTMILTKQNRDLQIVLKTVQEEQKKRSDGAIVPLKITRSVGIQVYIPDNERGIKRKNPSQTPPNNRNTRNAPNPSPKQQQQKSNTQIPVPRLVPATCNSPAKNTRPSTPQVQNITVTSNSGVKTSSQHPLPSGLRNSSPVKPVEKRPFSSVQSVTVDLTDDEPPSKQQVTARNAPQPPVRLVAQNQLLSARAQNQNNGPRKVYIPINSQNQAIRPGQTIMLKSVPPGAGPRPRNPRPMVTIPSNTPVRMPRHNGNHRHPAPLPDVSKQPQPPNWKGLPPSPDLKISKVENGIVISWKIEGYQEDSYEQIASYQLYAYQETASPPSTLLWKKIGDVKALPLPMACTLTQFMAGYKYFFAVRAIDIRSRIGPFSLPGSILLLNK